MARKKRLTNREKQARAEAKRRLQEQGVLPPDKPRLNRIKFIADAEAEWKDRSRDCYIWSAYLEEAITWMLHQLDVRGRVSPEAVGVAKVLKLALRFREFDAALGKKGETEYKLVDRYNAVKDILEA